MFALVLLALAAAASVEAFQTNTRSAARLRAAAAVLHAKKKKQDPDASDWYEDVVGDASAEDVFWKEMERRRLQSQAGVADSNEPSPIDMVSMIGSAASSSEDSDASLASAMAAQSAASSSQTTGGDESSYQNLGSTIADKTSTEATLSSYAAFAVSDNFLYDDEEEEMMNHMMPQNDMSLWEGEEPTLDEERAELDRQLDELERELMGDGVDGSVVGGASPYFDPQFSDEPWDRYGDSKTVDSGQTTAFHKELERRINMVSEGAREMTLDYDDDHPEEAEQEAEEDEAEYVKSLSSIGMHSPRLDNAAVNPKAEAYFRREPDQLQGFDTMWASSIDTPCTENLFGIFSNYGVQFADNFDDWQEDDDDQFRSIEDIASYKARKVYQVTGLPCIASRTSFEIEPIRPEDMDKPAGGTADKPATAKKMKQNQSAKSPRVVSGYRFNVSVLDYACLSCTLV